MKNRLTRGQALVGGISVDDPDEVRAGDYAAAFLRSIPFSLSYTDFDTAGGASGTATLATQIPAGAQYVQTIINSVTGFSGTPNASAGLFIGDGSDADRYSQGTINVFNTAAAANAGTPSGNRYHSAAGTPTFVVTAGSAFGSITAGQVTGKMLFYF